MQNSHPDFGPRRSVHRASLGWLWWLVFCFAPILLVTAVAAVFAVNSSGNRTGAFGCLGGSGLLLALIGAASLSEFRRWYATRTVKLVIYEKGFTYENQGHTATCSWTDIKDIDFKFIEVKSKHSAPKRVSVIQSVVKRDGTVISFAETLNPQKITSLITGLRKGDAA